MIETINLTKRFGSLVAVDRLNLKVESGEIFGFLGPNGAGKTTTIKMLTGLLIPDEGVALIDGLDVQKEPIKAKSIIGFIPDRPYLYEKLTGKEFLEFIAGVYEVDKNVEKRIEELFEMFELTKWKDELIESYSHGMRQKLVMSSALLHNPLIYIIDEPMVGLDPKSAKIVKEIYQNLAKKGKTIFLSTHSMEIVEKICNRVGIIQNGKLIALGTIEELKTKAKTSRPRPTGHLPEAGRGTPAGCPNLEDIFLELTGSSDLTDVVRYI